MISWAFYGQQAHLAPQQTWGGGVKAGPATPLSVHRASQGGRGLVPGGAHSPDVKFPSAAGAPAAAHKGPGAVPPP